MSARPAAGEPRAAWAPLAHPLFRALWIASLVSNVGTWMQDIGEAWLMTSLTPSPALVSLLRAAEFGAIFLLALPAGALADVLDRRRLLLSTQLWMLTVAGLLGAATLAGRATPGLLILAGFGLGVGSALTAPAWQAVIPEVVPRSELAPAITLNGVGFNIARAVGPAAGGALVAAIGPGAVFVLNAVSFLAVLLVLWRWKRPGEKSVLPAERVAAAIRTGVRYVRWAPQLHGVLIQAFSFLFSAIAVFALLPVLARHEMHLSAFGFGSLVGCFGAGAVAAAAVLPWIRARFSSAAIITTLSLAYAAGLAVAGTARAFPLVAAAMFLCGIAWLTNLSSFQVITQTSVPQWVRGRALAVYLLTTSGAMTTGASVWGFVATHAGITAAFVAAAGVLAAAMLAAARRFPLAAGSEELVEAAESPWPMPEVPAGLDTTRGPVLVSVEYRVQPGREEEFREAMEAVAPGRRRSGAFRWGLFQDTSDPTRFVEHFLVESWAEHLRQHGRGTQADRAAETRAREFLVPGTRASVTHALAERGGR